MGANVIGASLAVTAVGINRGGDRTVKKMRNVRESDLSLEARLAREAPQLAVDAADLHLVWRFSS